MNRFSRHAALGDRCIGDRWVDVGCGAAARQQGDPRPQQEVAAVEQLKTDAFKALRGGQFDRTNELLSRAAAMSHDPSVERMAGWANTFEKQREEFASERHEQYKKSLANVELLINKDHPDYAIDAASRAFLLADSKAAFRKEAGVDDLIKNSILRAEQYDKNEQWIKALRIYSDLGSIEPAVPTWKDKLQAGGPAMGPAAGACTSPDVLKQMQEGDTRSPASRDEVEAAAAATTTQPPNSPSNRPRPSPPTTRPTPTASKSTAAKPFAASSSDMLWDAA